jgi:hypothetical protein
MCRQKQPPELILYKKKKAICLFFFALEIFVQKALQHGNAFLFSRGRMASFL